MTVKKPRTVSELAAEFGRLGGKVKSERKAAAARANGQKGGWPKGKTRKGKDVSPSTGDVVTIGREWFRAGGKSQADDVVATRLIPMSPREIAAYKKSSGRPKGKQR